MRPAPLVRPRFNVAAADQPRKEQCVGDQDRLRIASMWPRLISRGKHSIE